jgi:Ecdysteroid kinase-like family
MTKALVAHHPSQLNLAWAQQIASQHVPGIHVNHIDITAIDIGTTTRVRLTLAHDAADCLPQQWFVKLPSLNWRARLITALPRLLPTEIRFYQQLSTIVPLRQLLLLAGKHQLGIGSTLVLADLAECGGQAGQTSDALTVEQALLVVNNLARFHAQFWQNIETNPNYQWLNSRVRQLEDYLGSALAVPLMQLGLKRAGDIIPPTLHAEALQYAKRRKRAMAFLNSGPKTLTHHDCHPGNLFWQHGQPGFLDWQMVRIGEGIGDLAYFFATALLPAVRQQYETALLTAYWQGLQMYGVENMTLQAIQQRYRAHLVYPFEAMVITLAIGGLMDLASNLELIRRAVAAVQDHEAFGALAL